MKRRTTKEVNHERITRMFGVRVDLEQMIKDVQQRIKENNDEQLLLTDCQDVLGLWKNLESDGEKKYYYRRWCLSLRDVDQAISEENAALRRVLDILNGEIKMPR